MKLRLAKIEDKLNILPTAVIDKSVLPKLPLAAVDQLNNMEELLKTNNRVKLALVSIQIVIILVDTIKLYRMKKINQHAIHNVRKLGFVE